MSMNNNDGTWYCPMCDTVSKVQYDCKCKPREPMQVKAANPSVYKKQTDSDTKTGRQLETMPDSVGNLDQAAQAYFNSVYGNQVWNAAIMHWITKEQEEMKVNKLFLTLVAIRLIVPIVVIVIVAFLMIRDIWNYF